MTVGDLYAEIDQIAPFASQEEWDNSGLLIGSACDPVSGVLFALDITQPVVTEALSLGVSVIVTHHPMMFSPRRRITDDDMEGKLIQLLVRNKISLISAHTNLDRAPGGTNDTLASLCGLTSVSGDNFFRSGFLSDTFCTESYADMLSESLRCTVRIMGPSTRMIRHVGISSGGGGEFWNEAAAAGCDAFVTGEMKHHHALAAADSGIVVFECGHYATEAPGIRSLSESLQKTVNKLKCNVRIFVSEIPAYSFSQQS